MATVQPGFTATVNLRLVPAREISLDPTEEGCQPRRPGSRPPGRPPLLTADVVGRLQDANKAVVAWLAKDAANAESFVADPVAALGQAGVELSRADLKALSRAHDAVRDAALLPPGAVLQSLTARADRRGRVGKPPEGKPAQSSGDSATNDAAC